MFSSFTFRPHSWLSIKGKRYAISSSHATRMNLELNTLEDLNETPHTRFFMDQDIACSQSITALTTTFATLTRCALPRVCFTSALKVGLVSNAISNSLNNL